MATTSKNNCSGKIWGDYRDVSGRVYACSRKATVERDGKWYCWQHDPEHVKADKKKRRASENAKQDRRSAMYARRALNVRLGALVTEELAALLEQMADYAREAAHCYEAARGCPDDVDGAYIAEETARATAARIREVLGEH